MQCRIYAINLWNKLCNKFAIRLKKFIRNVHLLGVHFLLIKIKHMLKIHSVETFGTHDWPGIRLVVFVQWCMFKCLYCHNPDTIPLTWWRMMSVEEVVAIVEKEKVYFQNNGWITISGGECLLQAKELIPLFQELKKRWIHTCLDTNGFILNDDVKKLLEYTDLVMPDIKQMDNEKHIKLTWQSNESVFKFIEYLEEKWNKFWIRHVLVPWLTNDAKHLNALWKYVSKFKNMERFEILPYNVLWKHKRKELWWKYELESIDFPTDKELKDTEKILRKYVNNLVVRN